MAPGGDLIEPGLIDMLVKDARKGWLVYVAGKMQTRRWRKDGEDSDRFSTESLLASGGRVQFLDKVNGNAERMPPGPDAAGDIGADPMDRDRIPF